MTFLSNVFAWSLRLIAWSVLAAVVLVILAAPRTTALNGRARQAHVRLESDAACAALFRMTGLDRVFDPQRYELAVSASPGRGLPLWLGLSDRSVVDYRDRMTWIWVTADGEYLLPPLANSQREGFDWKSIPDPLVLAGRDGDRLVGAILTLGRLSGQHEWSVWIHRKDRWVNALRFASTGSVTNSNLKPDVVDDVAVAVVLGGPVVRWNWNSERVGFDIPATLPTPLITLDLLPDQVMAND